MNIIERVRDILEQFPRISEVCGCVHIEFADPEPTSYGLSSEGDTLLYEDILGGQRRQHSFMLYVTYSSMNDYERLSNSTALLELSQWLGDQTGAAVESENGRGVTESLRAENGMLVSVPQENAADGVQYQLQIIAEYSVYQGGRTE